MIDRLTAEKTQAFSSRVQKANSQTVGNAQKGDPALRRRMLYPVELRARIAGNPNGVRRCGDLRKRGGGDRLTDHRTDRLTPVPATSQ